MYADTKTQEHINEGYLIILSLQHFFCSLNLPPLVTVTQATEETEMLNEWAKKKKGGENKDGGSISLEFCLSKGKLQTANPFVFLSLSQLKKNEKRTNMLWS